MSMTIHAAVLLIATLGVADATAARRPKPTPCSGRFAAHSPTFAGGQFIDVMPCAHHGRALVSFAPCGTIAARVFAKRKRTRLVTDAFACSGAQVVLKGTIHGSHRGSRCDQFDGEFQASLHGRLSFNSVSAAKPSTCGDRIVDRMRGEDCDGTPGCDADCHGTTTSTGAFGVVTVFGTQKMYLPLSQADAAGNGAIAVRSLPRR